MFVLALLLVGVASPQGATRVGGQIFDATGKPYAGITVQIKNPDTGQTYPVKTDKDGRFSQLLPQGGLYSVVVIYNEAQNQSYTEQHSIKGGQDNDIVINFKDVIAQQAAGNSEENKKAEEAANAFKNLKEHYDTGMAAMTDAAQVRQQLNTAPADQKSALQDKLKADYQTAVTELQQAELGAGTSTKDAKNHALIWASLGQALDGSNRFDEAANAYQKSIDLQPNASYYASLSTALAKAGTAQNDPKVTEQKVADAGAACDKAAALDPTTTAPCWKNVGIVLSNKGDLKDAIGPFQKATQANPKDAQTWYLLGSAFTGTIDTKQEGDKLVYVVPPGTTDAYQKCIDADPNGPYAPQAKAALDNISQLSGGVQTQIGSDKASKKKK